MRKTIQQRLVLEAAISLCHPTAEDIYQSISERYPSISRGTVYRNLNALSAASELRRVSVPIGPDRFDKTLAPHYHRVCKRCGAIEDAGIPYQEQIQALAAGLADFASDNHDIIFWGTCAKCRPASGCEAISDYKAASWQAGQNG